MEEKMKKNKIIGDSIKMKLIFMFLMLSFLSYGQSRVYKTESEVRNEFDMIALADTTDDGQRYLTVEYDEIVAFHFLSEGIYPDSNIVVCSALIFLTKGIYNNKVGQLMRDYYHKTTNLWYDYSMPNPIAIERSKIDGNFVVNYTIEFDE